MGSFVCVTYDVNFLFLRNVGVQARNIHRDKDCVSFMEFCLFYKMYKLCCIFCTLATGIGEVKCQQTMIPVYVQ